MSQAARIQGLSIGHALERESARSGVVHSVFARAVNLMVREEMWTLLAAEKADLPFGIRIASSQLGVLGFRNGDPVNFRAGFLSIGSGSTCRVVDCRAAPRWLPTRHNEIEPGLAGRLAVVATAASGRSWHESARMAQSVRSALECSVALGDAVAKVVGRGPGSTPSGDDVLVGILAVLSSPSSGAAGAMVAESLGRAILPLLWTTSDVSGQLLRQAPGIARESGSGAISKLDSTRDRDWRNFRRRHLYGSSSCCSVLFHPSRKEGRDMTFTFALSYRFI
jgi:hypothetical protein